MPTVLIIDDESNIRRMVGALLGAEVYDVRDASDGASGALRARESEPDAVLLDLMMPGDLDGMATLERLRAEIPDSPVIMMSGRAGLSDAVRATKLGAFTFLEKPLTPEGVLLALSSAMELRRARLEARALRADLGLAGEMVGESPGIQRVRDLISRVGPTDSRVLSSRTRAHCCSTKLAISVPKRRPSSSARSKPRKSSASAAGNRFVWTSV